MTRSEAKKQLITIASKVSDGTLSNQVLTLADSIVEYPSIDEIFFASTRLVSTEAAKRGKKYFVWKGNVYKLYPNFADWYGDEVCSVLDLDGIDKYTSRPADKMTERWTDYPWKNA